MLNFSRVKELILFDVCHSWTSMRSTIFIIPYFLFWLLIFSNVTTESLDWLKSVQGLFIASWLLNDQQLALNLIVDRSATLSLFLLISIAIMPLFVMFTANNQFSSDMSRGALRFILVRASRAELYLARFSSALLTVTICILVTCCWALVLAWLNEEASSIELITFATETLVLLMFYSMPFVAFMSLTSSLARSAVGNLFLAMMLYTTCVFVILATASETQLATYLIPSVVKPYVYHINMQNIFIAICLLCSYTIAYGLCGWFVFKRRDL